MNKFLVYFVFFTITILIFSIVPVVFEINSNSWLFILLFSLILIIVLGVMIYFSFRKIVNSFKQPDVEHIFKNYRSSQMFYSSKEMNFAYLHFKSLVFSLYGRFEEGLLEMHKIDLVNLSSTYEVWRLNAIALNNYLRRKNIDESIAMIEKAVELIRQNRRTIRLFRKIAEKSCETYIEIGEVLNCNYNESIIISLEKKFERFSSILFLLKLIVAWVLCIAYEQKREYSKKESMEAFLKKNAPYCRALFNFNPT
ncbi:hypothetical protein [Aquimarina celericrescens]|uniref:Tetratricopeptide repeat protein n=1 Tax=Aquimarina celericrescens TaxID=1964542 RepID=A0ABW5AVX5_9FLAO|nr:hypothetical protein [Aquimarina celericrescens]